MSQPASNAFIDFISTYGPSAASDSLCDENVRLASERYGIEPIDAPPAKLTSISHAILGDHPTNVILTGTAGDGKTYHIRRFLEGPYADTLGPVKDWVGSDTVIQVPLDGDRVLRIIRDLSEMSAADKADELERFVASLLGEAPHRIYLAGANDGQLLMYFRDAMTSDDASPWQRERCRRIFDILSEMLHSDRDVDERLSLLMPNLSRSWSVDTVDDIFQGILEHPRWELGCGSCAAGGATPTCPILLNRSLLRETADRPSMFRRRIRQVLALSAANDTHVPVRQVFTLVVNLLLGDGKRSSSPLLTCKKARRRAADGDYELTNPYDSIVGRNLSPEQFRASAVFSIFSMLGIGHETNNLLDSVLIGGKHRKLHEIIFGSGDQTYGSRIFDPHLRSYVSGEKDAAAPFLKALESQRRRAFFTLPEGPENPIASPWRLSVYHHGDDYLELMDAGAAKSIRTKHLRTLIRGLNRAYTGMMTKTDDKLWLAGTIGKTDNPVGRISIVEPLDRSGSGYYGIRLEMGASGRPRLAVTVKMPSSGQVDTSLELRPLLLEYLMRVASGSLPASFSRQCHQEIRHFALSVTEALRSLGAGDRGPEETIRVLALGSTGEILSNVVQV